MQKNHFQSTPGETEQLPVGVHDQLVYIIRVASLFIYFFLFTVWSQLVELHMKEARL